MADPLDETGFSEEHEPSTLPKKQHDDVGSPSDEDDLARLVIYRTPFPGTMLATGILWILAGAAYVALFALLRLLQAPFASGDLWLILGAFFFIKDGVQLFRGTFRDPQADGVISVCLGLYFLGKGWYAFEQFAGIVELIVDGFFGSIFLAPGILVFFGRKQYLKWKAEQTAF
jgi:hypothetical protein